MTIVQYDLTSSEDEELDPTVTYIMSSSKLSPPCITVSEDDSSIDERWNGHLISPVVQSVSTSCEKHSDEQSASSVHKASENESYSDCELSDDEKPGAAPVEELQSTSSEESDEQSPPAAKRSRLASRQQSSAESSSSEQEMSAKPVVSIDISSEDETVTAELPVSAGRKPYALRREELPSAAPAEELQSTSSEESDEQSPPAAKRSRLASRQQSSAESSSSEQEMSAKPVVSIDISSEDETVTAELPVSAGRKPYALRREELPSELRELLSTAKSFFTRPHSLQRAGQHIASSTYAKAEERILCKYYTTLPSASENSEFRHDVNGKGQKIIRNLLIFAIFLRTYSYSYSR